MTELARKSSVSRQTREQIVLAAERLFGESGIDAVSLRQINAEAGQRNSSAAHYHFGSKEALIATIFDYRMESINRRRLRRLDEIAKSGEVYDVRNLVRTIILPIVEEIEETQGGSHYIRFEAQLMGHPRVGVFSLWRSDFTEGLQQAYRLLKATMPEVPEIVFGQRFGMMLEMVVHSLADREIFRLTAEKNSDFNATAFLNNLVDTCAGAMTAPLSAATRHGFDQ